MRSTIIGGIVLILVGVVLFARGGTFTTRKDVIKVGDVKVTAPDDHTVPNWVAPVVVLAGIGLIAFGGLPRKA
jgi:hypothetical protein